MKKGIDTHPIILLILLTVLGFSLALNILLLQGYYNVLNVEGHWHGIMLIDVNMYGEGWTEFYMILIFLIITIFLIIYFSIKGIKHIRGILK